MEELPVTLILSVSDLCATLRLSVENRQWTDAALAAAAIWQGTDDALARTTSPLATVAGRARRLGPAGRLLGAVLERLVRLAALLPTSLAAQRDVSRWRDDVLEIRSEEHTSEL